MSTDPVQNYYASRMSGTRRDYATLRTLDLGDLPFSDRAHVAKGAVGLAGLMGDGFHRVEHRDDIPWNEAPLPRRWHLCDVWTSEWFGLSQVCRCACGAITENIRQKWHGKNSRRKRER